MKFVIKETEKKVKSKSIINVFRIIDRLEEISVKEANEIIGLEVTKNDINVLYTEEKKKVKKPKSNDK